LGLPHTSTYYIVIDDLAMTVTTTPHRRELIIEIEELRVVDLTRPDRRGDGSTA
jgi:hypothetical protein